MKNAIVAGIDVGTHTTRVVVCEVAEDEKWPRIIATGSNPSYGIRHGYVINKYDASKSVKLALRQAEQEAGIRIKECYLGLGGIGLSSEIVQATVKLSESDPHVTEADIKRAVQAAEKNLLNHIKNIKVIDVTPIRYTLDARVVHGKPLGMVGRDLTVTTLFVTYLEHHIEDLITVISDAGLAIVDVVAAPAAAGHALLTPKQKMAGCALLDIGAETMSLAVYRESELVSIKVFPLGSSDITNDIALGFQISLDEAEKAKQGTLNKHKRILSKTKLEEVVQARLADIFELVQKHLKKIGLEGRLPAGIFITGGGSQLMSLEDIAKASLKLPIKITTTETSQNQRRKLRDVAWYNAYGLCIYARETVKQTQKVTFNLSFGGITRVLKKLFHQLLP